MNQSDVYNYLIENGPCTVSDIAMGLTGNPGKSKASVRDRLAQLEKWEKVRVVGTVEMNPGNSARLWEAVCP